MKLQAYLTGLLLFVFCWVGHSSYFVVKVMHVNQTKCFDERVGIFRFWDPAEKTNMAHDTVHLYHIGLPNTYDVLRWDVLTDSKIKIVAYLPFGSRPHPGARRPQEDYSVRDKLAEKMLGGDDNNRAYYYECTYDCSSKNLDCKEKANEKVCAYLGEKGCVNSTDLPNWKK